LKFANDVGRFEELCKAQNLDIKMSKFDKIKELRKIFPKGPPTVKGVTYNIGVANVDRRRLIFPRRRCDSPVLIRLLKEIYDANDIDLVET